ncbi:MAG: hypothetical protein HOV96_07695 [Nonomuraea sp.]|nr:hypothetical protein [Nonomuraea sp.]NUP63766.1 hypothetical protein [Nonomuraea sp.]NUP77416.1 hypothetical protein [Nonomuraea sp.]NUT10056.1 hypothetical protein [Nonomuraea sp.]
MDTGIAREGDSPLFDGHGRSFWITVRGVPLPQLDLHGIAEMLPNHLKRLVRDLLRQIGGDLLGRMEHADSGPRGHHLAREPHRSRHSGITGREGRSQHRMGRSTHPNVPTTLLTDLG